MTDARLRWTIAVGDDENDSIPMLDVNAISSVTPGVEVAVSASMIELSSITKLDSRSMSDTSVSISRSHDSRRSTVVWIALDARSTSKFDERCASFVTDTFDTTETTVRLLASDRNAVTSTFGVDAEDSMVRSADSALDTDDSGDDISTSIVRSVASMTLIATVGVETVVVAVRLLASDLLTVQRGTPTATLWSSDIDRERMIVDAAVDTDVSASIDDAIGREIAMFGSDIADTRSRDDASNTDFVADTEIVEVSDKTSRSDASKRCDTGFGDDTSETISSAHDSDLVVFTSGVDTAETTVRSENIGDVMMPISGSTDIVFRSESSLTSAERVDPSG